MEEYLNKIINIDCMKILPELPDRSIDLILTDFPYGVDIDYGETYIDSKENLKELIKKVMPEILRVSKRALITCGQSNITYYPQPKWVLAWVNPAGANRNPWGFTCWQPILCYGKDPFLENRMGSRQDIIIHNEQTKKLGHPCAKPIKLWEKLLVRGSVNEDDIILDPFAGAGTTCVAAQRLHRKFIGIEINEGYCQIARRRLMQKPLL